MREREGRGASSQRLCVETCVLLSVLRVVVKAALRFELHTHVQTKEGKNDEDAMRFLSTAWIAS